METIKDTIQLESLIQAAKKKIKASNINSFLLANQLENLCKQGHLFYEKNEAGLFVYNDLERSISLYFYINTDIPFTITPKHKPIICEFIGLKCLSEKSKKTTEQLKKTGFTLNMSSQRMCKLINSQPLPTNNLEWQETEMQLCTANIEHIDQIITLWENTFNPIGSDLPSKSELAQLITDGCIICVLNNLQRVVGVLQIELSEHACWSRHCAVSQEERGKNIGRALTVEYHRLAAEKNAKILYLWVSEDSAARFHSHFGYNFDGRLLEQYIIKDCK